MVKPGYSVVGDEHDFILIVDDAPFDETELPPQEMEAIVAATIYGWGGRARVGDQKITADTQRRLPMGCRLRNSFSSLPVAL